MRGLVAAALLVPCALPAAAERLAYSCDFTSFCDDAGCTAEKSSYQFRFDTEAGTAEMLAGPETFAGSYAASGRFLHFILVNDAGIEAVTIAPTGEASYSGHVSLGDDLLHYRLDGQCTSRSK